MMPRRGNEVVALSTPPKKKSKTVEEAPSLDVSFIDDKEGEALSLPPGYVLTDIQQKNWRVGKPIGKGSFGRIYLASDNTDTEVTKQNARYVVKIEPFTNGPLFVEIHCLIRTGQASKVKLWRRQKKQKRLGMPIYIASGSFEEKSIGSKFRFLVLPRYYVDLQKVISRTRVLDLKNVLMLAIQVIDVLEYMHSQGYTHSDIKSSNLMIGFDGTKQIKSSITKQTPSFQKETKSVSVLTGKQRRPKNSKSRSSNYYDDEDFIIKDTSPGNISNENDKRLASVKKKLRKLLTDKDSRTLHRHHAFNLRQLSNYVNYEDLNSSVCSDHSYQRLLDDFGNTLIRSTEEKSAKNIDKDDKSESVQEEDIFKEAILSQSNGQIYLLDYGLASKFVDSDGNHKEFGMDARKAHDGTLEYSSRDSHIGAHSRRSDLETLGYNLLDWLTGTLPWKASEVLSNPDLVHIFKKNFMSDIKLLLKTCFKTEFYPQFMEKYLEYIVSLEFTETPDYDYCRSIFRSELLKNGYISDNKEVSLNFSEAPMSPMMRSKLYSNRFGRKSNPQDFASRNGINKSYERENVHSLENDLKLELLKQTLNSSSDGVRKPCSSRNFFVSDADLIARLKKSLLPHDIFGKKLSPKNLRSKQKPIKKRRGVKKHRSSIGKFGNFMGSARQFTWAEILAGNPEDIIRKERNANSSDNDDDESNCKYRIRKLSNASSDSNIDALSPLMQKDYLKDLNATCAMKEIVANLKKKISSKCTKEVEPVDCIPGYTPAMVKVYQMKLKREANEKAEALKQQNAVKKDVAVPQQRNTRSSKKSAEKVRTVVPVTRVTRAKLPAGKKTKEVDEINKNKETHKVEITKHKETIKTKSVKSKKVVQIVEEVTPPAKQTKPKAKTVKVTIPNRRCLRSSRRNQKVK